MLKILFMIAILVLLSLPFLPIKAPFTFYFFNFPEKKRPKNLIYICSTLAVIILTLALMPYILRFSNWFSSLKFIKWLLGFIPAYANYSSKILNCIFINLLFCAAVLFANWIAGTLAGRYPKFSPASFKQFIANLKEKRKLKKQERKQKKEEKKNKKDGADTEGNQTSDTDKKEGGNKDGDKPKEEKKKRKFGILPPHLIPSPEENANSDTVTLFGKKEETKVTKNKAVGLPAAVSDGKDGEFSFKRFLLKLLSLFYIRHEDVWYVQPQCKKVAKHLRNFIIIVSAAYLILIALLLVPVFFAVKDYAKEFYNIMLALVDNCYLYPAVSLSLLVQVFWFMNGTLPEEPVDTLSYKSGKQSVKIIDLADIENKLISTFGKEYEIKSFNSGAVESQNSRQPLDISENGMLQNVLSFVTSQKLVRNDDYLRGIKQLSCGDNVLFDAPLFTAVSMYLYPYLNVRISQGERMVVICQDESKIDEVIENLREGFRRVQRAHACQWVITDRQNLNTSNETDILVITPETFLDDRFYTEASQFFCKTSIALFPDADNVVMSNNYLCLVMAEKLKQHCADKLGVKNIQYIFLATRHTLNLARNLKEYFLLEDDIFDVQADFAYGSIRLHVWRAIKNTRQILDNAAQTISLETAISNIASQLGIPKVTMFTDSAIFPSQIDPVWLETYDVFNRPIGFTIVSDDSYNLPGTIYTYARYIGKEASVLHVVSKPYMLRDYFYDSAVRSLYERPLMERGMTEHAVLEQTSMILLLCRLSKGIPASVFVNKMAEITGKYSGGDLSYDSIKLLVDECLTRAFGVRSTADQYGFMLDVKEDEDFNKVRMIKIVEDKILDKLLEDTSFVTVQIGQTKQTIPLFKRMLAQKYIQGQHMIINHQSYMINSIDYERGLIIATPAVVVHNVPDQYIQVREYTFAENDQFLGYCKNFSADAENLPENVFRYRSNVEGKSDINNITLIRAVGGTKVTSHTVAYYDSTNCPDKLDLLNDNMFYVETNIKRDVNNALYLRLDGNFNQNDKVTMTLSVLLQEIMKTMFPDHYFCISVCPIFKDRKSIYESGDKHSMRIAKMYPKLMNWESEANNAVELVIMDDCEGGTGVLDMLFQPQATYLRNILDMLCDYLHWLEEHPEDNYLNFGAESVPALFQFPKVKELLEIFHEKYVRETELFKDIRPANSCKFCGKPLDNEETFVWNNKYNICKSCSDEHKPDENEANLILENAEKFLSEKFGITFDAELSVAFDESVDVSAINIEEKKILLSGGLPLTAVHCEVVSQLVRFWQIDNLFITGEPEFDGQVMYVLIQYLTSLSQYKRCSRLHNSALIGTDNTSVGYCRLRQALLAIPSDNSFKYMLENFGNQDGKDSNYQSDKKRSTRKTTEKEHTRFFYEHVEERYKAAYDKIFDGFMNMADNIDLSDCPVDADDFNEVFRSVLADHPEIYWVVPYKYSGFPSKVTNIAPTYYKISKEELEKRQREIDDKAAELMEGITDEMGDFETALQVFKNITAIMDYDSLELAKQDRLIAQYGHSSTITSGPDDLRNIYGALVNNRIVCAGYAKAYQYILNKLGMECLYVVGECIGGEYHAWNIVNMEGDYYHVDVTWGDGSNTDPSKDSKHCSFNYFGLTDKEISLSRVTDASPKAPACTENACNYFVRMGLYFRAYDHYAIKQKLIDLMGEADRIRIDFRFENSAVYKAAYNQLIDNGGIFEALRKTNRSVRYTFSPDEKLNILSIFLKPEQSDN